MILRRSAARTRAEGRRGGKNCGVGRFGEGEDVPLKSLTLGTLFGFDIAVAVAVAVAVTVTVTEDRRSGIGVRGLDGVFLLFGLSIIRGRGLLRGLGFDCS